jgi:hypothetical protein
MSTTEPVDLSGLDWGMPEEKPKPVAKLEAEQVSQKPSYQVFHTEGVEPPALKFRGRTTADTPALPFSELLEVNSWFVIPPFPDDPAAAKRAKGAVARRVYKSRPGGHRFSLRQIDQRFADEVGHPELLGRWGVWRTK